MNDIIPTCSCTIDMPGTRHEMRVLDRACPRHGDDALEARREHVRGKIAEHPATAPDDVLLTLLETKVGLGAETVAAWVEAVRDVRRERRARWVEDYHARMQQLRAERFPGGGR